MTSQPGQQTIPIHILPNTSQSKGNQVMKFSQVIEDNKGNISPSKFMQKISQGNCFQISFFVSYKSFVCVKNKWSAAQFQFISIALNLKYNINNLYKTLNY